MAAAAIACFENPCFGMCSKALEKRIESGALGLKMRLEEGCEIEWYDRETLESLNVDFII